MKEVLTQKSLERRMIPQEWYNPKFNRCDHHIYNCIAVGNIPRIMKMINDVLRDNRGKIRMIAFTLRYKDTNRYQLDILYTYGG